MTGAGYNRGGPLQVWPSDVGRNAATQWREPQRTARADMRDRVVGLQDAVASGSCAEFVHAVGPGYECDAVLVGVPRCIHAGIVEQVGIRSTRIRTAEDSILVVPNGQLADATINNLGTRRHRLMKTTLVVDYLSLIHI